MSNEQAVDIAPAVEAVNAPGRNEMPVENRAGAEVASGSNDYLAWGARSDVGLVRAHNEDSFLVAAPVFAVCDGMGGHAAGEVASGIAVATIADLAPDHADEILLGAAVEAANAAVLEGAANGMGKPGMGCTASCILIEKNRMSIAHVGDSRVYLLHGGTLVRITHDHSYVEELVDAGEITADEARVHPSRSVITRALGSDPDMYADHFTIDVNVGDRILLCSDGLSGMIEDSQIEAIAMSSPTPQTAVDNLVAMALQEGGHDNVTVVVIDVTDDGVIDKYNQYRLQRLGFVCALTAGFFAVLLLISSIVVSQSWFVGVNDDTVGIYRGVNASVLGHDLYKLEETSAVRVSDLPDAVQANLRDGITASSQREAQQTIQSYQKQIEADRTRAQQTADKSSTGTDTSPNKPAVPKGPAEDQSSDSRGEESLAGGDE